MELLVRCTSLLAMIEDVFLAEEAFFKLEVAELAIVDLPLSDSERGRCQYRRISTPSATQKHLKSKTTPFE